MAALSLGLAFRLWGILWGLPHAFNADEPHLVNLAVSFGGGSLRPYAFKYPSLWPYLLFVAYGFYFLIWSGFGLLHRVSEFAGYFGWHPGGFYLIGRLMSAAASLGAVFVVWRVERRERGVPWAALLIALSPAVVDVGRTLKPDSMMLLFCALGWACALRVLDEGGRRPRLWCGLFFGLGFSSQFTALPAALALPLAHFLSRKPKKTAWLLQGLAAFGAGFLIGTPYALLDFTRFRYWTGMHGIAATAALGDWSRAAVARDVAANLWNLGGPGSIAGLAAVVGLAAALRRDARKAALLAPPIAAYVLVLSSFPDGGWPRYLLGVFPALAFLSAEGLSLCEGRERPLLVVLVLILALLPGAARDGVEGARMSRPDTRQEAQDWIEARLPAQTGVLMDEPHAGPDLAMTKSELEDLAARVKEAGSPRWRLFDAMARSHPGGGYRILRVARTARDLGTYHPKQVELSQADAPVVDVRPGLDFVRAQRVDYVLTSSYGADLSRAPELSVFFSELERQAPLEAVFTPVPGKIEGPALRLYRLKP